MKDKKNIWVAVGVVVVILAVILIFVWKPTSKPAGAPAPVYAPQGQLTPQFPKQLILDTSAAVNGSYSIGYSSSTNQYTAEFNSSSSMATEYASYKQYFSSNGWTLTNDITKYPTSRGLYASNASADAAIGIVSVGSGSQVTISYVTK
jgi:hypothetical protein